MAFVTVNKSDRNVFKKLGNRIGGLSNKFTKRISTSVTKITKQTNDRIKSSIHTWSAGSYPQVRTNPRRIALASPIGTSPNHDQGGLKNSIKWTANVARGSRNIRSEVGTIGAFDNGINYAEYHEHNGRPFIKPEEPKFRKDIISSSDRIMKKISELK